MYAEIHNKVHPRADDRLGDIDYNKVCPIILNIENNIMASDTPSSYRNLVIYEIYVRNHGSKWHI